MPSPLPGMNPFLEQPELWSEFHSRMIVAIADALDEIVSREYRVAVEKRVYLSQDDEQVLIGIPDVAVTRQINPSEINPSEINPSEINPRSDRLGVIPLASGIALAEPLTVEFPSLHETQERYLEIREGATGNVITVIELLSPKNKRAGEGRNAYLQKRQQIISSQTHLIEIDLLRAGVPLPLVGLTDSDYRILVSRSGDRPQAQLYAFNLEQVIPTFAVPLRQSDPEPLLQLQPLVHKVYDRSRFELAIDYTQPLTPQLSPDQQHWAESLVAENLVQ